MSQVAVQSASFSPTIAPRRINAQMWVRQHIVALNLISLVIVGILVASYIVQVNTTIAKGYQIRDLETQVNELALINQKLELETRQNQSLTHVSKSVKMLGFVKAEQPNYISTSEPTFALAQ